MLVPSNIGEKELTVKATQGNARKVVNRGRRTNEERSAETRSALTEAVIECLCDIGYARTTVQEISRRSGITSGAMQHHFGGKEDLLAAALDKLRDEAHERLEALASSKGSVRTRVKTIVRDLWAAYYGHPRYMAVWEIVVGSRGDKKLHEKVIEHRRQSMKALEATWVRAFNLDDKDDKQAAFDAMQFALSFMRGSVLLSEDRANDDFVERQLSLLDNFLIQALGLDNKARALRFLKAA
jgi:AcrR family transcriptional regulator